MPIYDRSFIIFLSWDGTFENSSLHVADASKYVIVVVLDDFVCILFGCGDGVRK